MWSKIKSQSAAPTPSQLPIRSWLLIVAVAVLLANLAGLNARATYGARVSGDEPQYLLTATSIGEDGDLNIADELAEERFRTYHRADLNGQTFSLDPQGTQISPHDPGLPALLAVPMRLGGWRGAKAALIAFGVACAVGTAWIAIRKLGVAPSVAATSSIAAGCSLPLAAYSTQVYPEIVAACLLLVIVSALLTPASDDAFQWWFWAGVLAVTLMPWLSIKYLPVAAAAGLALVWTRRDDRALLVVTACFVALCGVVYLVAHREMFGGWTAYATGDHFIQTGEFSVMGSSPNPVGRTRRLVGLLLDRTFGIAVWQPFWLLLPVGLGAAAGARRSGLRLLLFIVASGWLTATFVAFTMHGWWVPGRQIVVVMPIATLLIAVWLGRFSRPAALALGAIGAIGIVNWLWLALEASNGALRLIIDAPNTANPLPHALMAITPDGMRASATDDVLLVAYGAVLLATVGWGYVTARRAGQQA